MAPKNKYYNSRILVVTMSLVVIIITLFSFSKSNLHPLQDQKYRRPNIIVFMSDDFGYDLPAYTGNQSFVTPNLDYMAANGVQFTNCYSHPDGYPSRLAFQTGKYNHNNYTEWGKLPYGSKTLGNLLKDAGYATMYLGRWSFDGGDTMIKKAGFDKYIVTLPFADYDNEGDYRHMYKDPWLYINGLLDTVSYEGLFSEDLYFDQFSSFVDSMGQKPFFVMYANSLVREPLTPTPGHPEYAGFDVDTAVNQTNNLYFESMVEYLDKSIGKVIQKLENEGIAENTMIIFVGDNATDRGRRYRYNGRNTFGHKNRTYKLGIQTPLTVYWPGTIKKGGVCNELISYTDFLPTISKIAGLPVSTSYGTIHGLSFYHNMVNIPGVNREWNYIYWDNSPNDTKHPIRFIHDTKYKLYKDTFGVKTYYKIDTDTKEDTPLTPSNFTLEQLEKFSRFEFLVDSLWVNRYN